jgi:signal transduction histidine kinase
MRSTLLPIRITFLLVAFAGYVQAQNLALVDSLKRQIAKVKPVDQFELLCAIGFEYRYSYPDSTIIYCQKAYDLGRSLKISKSLSKPLSFAGLAYANKGDYLKSLDYHYLSIEVASEENDSIQLAYAYNNLGRMFFDGGDIGRAYDNLIRSKALFEILKDKSGLAYVYRSLANVYKSRGENSLALEMSTRALELRKEMGDPRAIASAYMELGLVYQALHQNDLALSKLSLADSVANTINDKVTVAEIGLGIAELLVEDKKYDKAEGMATKVLETISEKTNRKLFLRASLVLGKYYIHLGQDNKAIPILEKIMAQSESSAPYFQRDASNLLYDIYNRQKNGSKATDYLNTYTVLNERLQNQDLIRQVERLQFQLEIEKKEKENDALKASQAKDKTVISTQRFQNILLVILVLLASTIAFILWTASRKRRLINHKLALQNEQIYLQREEISVKNQSLSKQNQELSEINHEKDTLMNIVAHDLKSPLNRILGLLEIIQRDGQISGESVGYFNMARESARSGLDLITDLLDVNALQESGSFPVYSSFNLGDVLEECTRSHRPAAEAKGIRIFLNNTVLDQVNSDPDYINRILDNLLSNGIKFSAKSSAIHVSSERRGENFIISVKDEGPGFTPQDKLLLYQKFKKLSARPTGGESSNGLGLAIVKTLVDRLGGDIELTSQPSHGSTFLVSIPNHT